MHALADKRDDDRGIIDVLRFVRRHQQYRNLPVIVLTTRGDDSSRQAAIEAGATTYMTKPFAPQILAATARTLLSSADVSATRA